MHESIFSGNRSEDYPLAIRQASQLWEQDLPLASNLANISALLKQCLQRTNWVGFYLWQQGAARAGPRPFPGAARVHADRSRERGLRDRGGNKTDAARARRARVPGHIACDSASESEIVVPIIRDDEVLGVLDVDSPEKARFDDVDRQWLEKLVHELIPLWPRAVGIGRLSEKGARPEPGRRPQRRNG